MRANVYIRKENEAKWEAVADKSAWVNALLSNSDDTSQYGALKPTPVGPMITVLSENLSKSRAAQGLCKIHQTPLDSRGRCLQKGCKYS